MTVSARAADAGLIEVSVRDDGPGIPPELLPRVFERFVKEPGSGGSGLGLAICRDLVEAQGGRIWIDNGTGTGTGTGTTVTFTLPLA